MAAGRALNVRRMPAAIEQQDHLPAFAQRFVHRPVQRPADRAARVLVVHLVSQIDRPHRRHRPIEHSPRHLHELRLAPLRPLPTFERRRRAGQHQRHVLVGRSANRHVAGVIPRRRFLLERRFVLLVEHDQPKVRRGSKDGAPCPDHHFDLAPRDPPPMLVTLDVAHVAMEHGHAIEPRPKAGHRLRREADLRHKQNRLPAEAHDFFDRLDIDFGLAAAGHAVNENRAMLGRVQRIANRRQRATLDRRSIRAATCRG